jgi:hypothetical protein
MNKREGGEGWQEKNNNQQWLMVGGWVMLLTVAYG